MTELVEDYPFLIEVQEIPFEKELVRVIKFMNIHTAY
jgi:hypothetical protein